MILYYTLGVDSKCASDRSDELLRPEDYCDNGTSSVSSDVGPSRCTIAFYDLHFLIGSL